MILVAVPVHKDKLYSLDVLLKKLDSLTYPEKRIVLHYDILEYGRQDGIKSIREFFRQLTLKGDYSHLMMIGCDTIPPDDVIEKLLKVDEPIVSGIYYGRFAKGGEGFTKDRAVAWIHKDHRQEFINKEKVSEVDGVGMDCILIRRDVLQKVSWTEWEINDDDYPFCDLAKERGFKIHTNNKVICRHYINKSNYV